MTTKVVYIAADGTEFETETECSAYELMNGDNKEILMCDPDGELVDAVDMCAYVYLKTDEAARTFYQANTDAGLSVDGLDPEGAAGFYVWNEYDDMWHYMSPDDVHTLYKAAAMMEYLN